MDTVREYIKQLEDNYRDLKNRGARTIDIDIIIHDLMQARISIFKK